MVAESNAQAPERAEFYQRIAGHSLAPLWEVLHGLVTKTPQTPAPFWLYYFNVEAVDRATARAKDGGGEVLNGPMQVPGGSWIVQCRDPQGAMFAMVGPKR